MTRPRRAPTAAEPLRLRIQGVGGRGDGIAEADGRRLYVPFTVPGDIVTARPGAPRGDGRVADLLVVETPGPDRVPPSCRHFGLCGGCAFQHWASGAVADWKRDRVRAALTRRGLDVTPRPTVEIAPGSRRRATLAIAGTGRRAIVGFNRRGSAHLVDLIECPLLDPALVALVASLRDLIGRLESPPRRGDARTTLCDDGVDLLLVWPDAPGRADRERLAAFAGDARLVRLAWAASQDAPAEPLAILGPARVRFGDLPLDLPPGAFLQPSADGESRLRALVADSLGDAARIADLFAGCGTFSLPLSRAARVHAVESDAVAMAALAAAAGSAGLGGRLTVEARDLERRPLAGRELARFDAALFDPPRAGASAQAAALAADGPPTVVAVSCHPPTFARDARLLIDGGYRLQTVTPVDQFPWTPHVEVVARFERPKRAGVKIHKNNVL